MCKPKSTVQVNNLTKGNTGDKTTIKCLKGVHKLSKKVKTNYKKKKLILVRYFSKPRRNHRKKVPATAMKNLPFYVLHGDFATLRKLTAQVGRQTAAAAAVTQLLRIPEKFCNRKKTNDQITTFSLPLRFFLLAFFSAGVFFFSCVAQLVTTAQPLYLVTFTVRSKNRNTTMRSGI